MGYSPRGRKDSDKSEQLHHPMPTMETALSLKVRGALIFLPSFEPGNFHVLAECDNYCGNWTFLGFPGGSDGKESAFSAGELSLIPGLGRSPGEGRGKPLQYSCLENPMDRGGWWVTVHRVAKSQI